MADEITEGVPGFAASAFWPLVHTSGRSREVNTRGRLAPPIPGAAGPTDTEPPVVGNFDPPPGTALARDTVISFDVTDDAGLAAVLIAADFGFSGAREVVYDATGFAARYAGSTREEIPGGFRFRIARVGGWPEGGGPTLLIDAVDTAGNRPVLLGQGPTMTLDFGATHRRAS